MGRWLRLSLTPGERRERIQDVLNGRNELLTAYPELTPLLRDLPDDTRLVDADRNVITLYVEAGKQLLKLKYTRYNDGRVETSVETLDEL